MVKFSRSRTTAAAIVTLSVARHIGTAKAKIATSASRVVLTL
jgi:hypothetical protein